MLYVESPYTSSVSEQDAYTTPTNGHTAVHTIDVDLDRDMTPLPTSLPATFEDDQELEQEELFFTDKQGLYAYISDEDFETANRAFHATINKFSRQNYHGRRSAYTFLENWCLHSIYSKSQQILLGMPHIRPMVLLNGDDFMFTPPLLQQEDDDEEYYLDDHALDLPLPVGDHGQPGLFEEDVMDEDGIVIMSAPDPPPLPTVLTETTWMKNQHSFHAMPAYEDIRQPDNDDDDDDDDPQDEPSWDNAKPPFSEELIHWYRSTERQRPPSTILNYPLQEDEDDNSPAVEDDHDLHTVTSLIMTSSPLSSVNDLQLPPPTLYGTSSSSSSSSQHDSSSILSDPPLHITPSWIKTTAAPLGLEDPLLASVKDVLDIAQSYRQQPSPLHFLSCVYQIWQVFFLTAELMLAMLWTKPNQPLLPL
ncbi:hypothetical protein DM01DRAFT_1337751 [Hesseltinella vesiculosa]|uniref:Uncharacterized protein n=1 Tax=Hesseltinella vesiculosa TaxID=101127 RepID=A0A1X2GCJ0_9FUNG|nr:hypothetical protein DM01DRAFT_1337751 [Hesseltinella vesiculosa]